jgi:hypothetical protein
VRPSRRSCRLAERTRDESRCVSTWPSTEVIFCRKDKPKERETFAVREPKGWAVAVASFPQCHLDDGAVVILYGDCPRCGDLMDVELPIALQTGGEKVSAARDAQLLGRPTDSGAGELAFFKTARCNCQTSHEGRPEDVKDGCGAFGMIQVG